tara:strand:+ start:5047 stop:6714 length:1668 start_codon:yes stop_codon:yes gene_type:complete
MKTKPLHFNVPQITHQLVGASKSYNVWSRGTGKTSGILAPWYIKNAQEMPRGQHGIVGSTFQQLLTRTLPPIIQMWNRMGYFEGKHFVVGREPSDKFKTLFKWQPPRSKPLDSKYAIYWFNGACNILISQDRAGSSNGLSLASLGGDEAKLLNKERLDDETIPALRGDRNHFGHLSSYRSECYTTDMPTTPASKWILDMAAQMDETQIELILQVQLQINLWQRDLLKSKGHARNLLQAKINKYKAQLHKLRMPRKVDGQYKYSVYYSEASALDNLDVLGVEYLSDMKRILSDVKYRTSILNEKLVSIEGGFYPNLDPVQHGTDWFNYSYLDNFIVDINNKKLSQQDCRHDAGFIKNRPLDVAFDYGDRINCMVVGQEVDMEYRFLNSFYVLSPQLVDSVVDKFCAYFEHYPTKVVNYYFDHTAIGGSGVTEFTYHSRVMSSFRKNGWRVVEEFIGRAPGHENKYEFINLLLRETEPRLPRFRYSKTNCANWEVSVLNAGAKTSNRGFQKDKSPERNKKLPAEDATHLSDAGDTLLFAKFHDSLSEMPSLPSSMGS